VAARRPVGQRRRSAVDINIDGSRSRTWKSLVGSIVVAAVTARWGLYRGDAWNLWATV